MNSQAALLIGDDGSSFIQGVNAIKALPYLPFVETLLLGVPIFIHAVWGIKYLRTAKYNSFGGDLATPYLPQYSRNHAYTWQRITAWLLLFAILAHVIHMRFIEYPASAKLGSQSYYMVRLDFDEGLYTLGSRLDFALYDRNQIQLKKEKIDSLHSNPSSSKDVWQSFLSSLTQIFQRPKEEISSKEQQTLLAQQHNEQEKEWLSALEKRPLKAGQVVAVTKDFGTAELLMLRDTFKMPVMLVLYTIFVLAACFHAFNGVWTFLIKWGVTITAASQHIFLKITTAIMVIVAFFGLASIWLTYWINLKQ